MSLSIGDVAPDFSLPDENGDLHTLSEYRGKPVVLFFYPEDDTPGCTEEACNFRDDYAQYRQAGAQLLGVSPDNSSSHEAFKSKFSLPFTLLADEGHKVAEQYGVWGAKKTFGISYEGLIRTTFLIDGEGKVARVFIVNRIKPHSQEVLTAVQELEQT